MGKAIDILKCSGAVIVFAISYVVCSIITQIFARLVNFDAQGFWVDLIPYSAAFVAGIFSVFVGLSVVDRVFRTVRPRTVVGIFFGIIGFFWAFPLLGLLLGLVGFIDAPLQSHGLWSANTPPLFLETIVAGITAWKLTGDDGEFGRRRLPATVKR